MAAGVAQRDLEQGPVDAPVVDGDAHLDALSDHLLSLHVELVGKL
jgi:hypothetical protein